MRKTIGTAGLLALGLVEAWGCASPPYQGPRMPQAGAQVPPEVEYWKGNFKGAGDVQLFEQGWRPSGPARAVVVFMHGLKDHSGRYRDLGVQLAHRGIALYGFDLQGHGYSEGVRDHVPSLDDAVADLATFVGRVRDRQPKVPLFLAGQGLGASLVALYDARDDTSATGLVLAAPFVRGDVKGTERFGTRMAAIFTSTREKLELDLDDWSSDARAVSALKNDPLVYDGNPTAATARELLRASDELKKAAGKVTSPVLLIHGSGDKITSVEEGRALHAQIGAADKSLQIYEGLLHDVFHETKRDQVVSDVLAWITTHAAAAAAAPAEPKAEAPGAAALEKSAIAAAPSEGAPQKSEGRSRKKLRKAAKR